MSNDNNTEHLSETDQSIGPSKTTKKAENLLLKGWNTFITQIKEGFDKINKSIQEQSKSNLDVWNENKEKINRFFNETKENIENAMKDWSLEAEKMRVKNKELWEKNKGQIDAFLKNTQQEWNSNFQKWVDNLKAKQIESKQQWEARKQKIKADIKTWQEQTKKNWEEGLKSWRKELIKGSYLFLVFMIPILIVVFVIVALINWAIPD